MRKIFFSLLLGFTSVIVIAPSAMAAKTIRGATTTAPVGIDISYPQCAQQIPRTQAFGIVGVNGGLATTTNSCLKAQLVWASKSVGGTLQDKIQLYVNTANPGGLNTASWPTTSTFNNPNGICDGSDSLACAWQYGWNRASEDVTNRFLPAATLAAVDTSPSAYIWWLDV